MSTLDPAAARSELDGRNEICGDTWCEGSFEWFFYDLRGDRERSELTMRVYSVPRSGADARSVVVKGPKYVGRVLDQQQLSSCTSPCKGFAEPPLWKPCVVLDLRCELAIPWSEASREWDDTFIACGLELERAVRKVLPEF